MSAVSCGTAVPSASVGAEGQPQRLGGKLVSQGRALYDIQGTSVYYTLVFC